MAASSRGLRSSGSSRPVIGSLLRRSRLPISISIFGSGFRVTLDRGAGLDLVGSSIVCTRLDLAGGSMVRIELDLAGGSIVRATLDLRGSSKVGEELELAG